MHAISINMEAKLQQLIPRFSEVKLNTTYHFLEISVFLTTFNYKDIFKDYKRDRRIEFGQSYHSLI